MKTSGFFVLCLLGFVASVALADDVADRKTVTSRRYVDTVVATKQPVLNPEGSDWTNQVVMYTDEAGTVDHKPISTTLTGSGIDSNLPTVGAVNTGLAGKQEKLGQNKTSGNVVTYTNTPGTLGEHAVYNGSATYNANGLVEANHVNTAIQNGLNNHLTCAGNAPGTTNCWLYTINDQTSGTVYTPHQVSGQ
ncbi:MAG: hypothetical protein J6Y07_00435 [Alphaproteobacteria bacterium]|nr:hypothetical protein [Alphaproteobacteria bacterium]